MWSISRAGSRDPGASSAERVILIQDAGPCSRLREGCAICAICTARASKTARARAMRRPARAAMMAFTFPKPRPVLRSALTCPDDVNPAPPMRRDDGVAWRDASSPRSAMTRFVGPRRRLQTRRSFAGCAGDATRRGHHHRQPRPAPAPCRSAIHQKVRRRRHARVASRAVLFSRTPSLPSRRRTPRRGPNS